MADSNRTSLLREHSSEDVAAVSHTESTPCLFDRLSHPILAIFTVHNLTIASGPLATLIIFCLAKYHGFSDGTSDRAASSKKIGAMLGALVWIAVWWMLEPVPIAITSLLPLVLFPFFGIMESEAVASAYTNDIVILMLGTFILALAINKYDLHKRMALKILLLAGGEKMDPRLVLLGFIVGPGFISMWMSNTSAAAMMIPMATGVLHNLHPECHLSLPRTKSGGSMARNAGAHSWARDAHSWTRDAVDRKSADFSDEEADVAHAKEAIHKYSQGVILAVTYGVALGGMATIIGTGPNLVLPGIYGERFPDAPEVSFLAWMKFAMPLVLVWSGSLWLFLCWRYSPSTAVPVIEANLNRTMIEKAYRALGPISFVEIFIFSEFIIIVVLWVTRSFGQTPGWAILFDNFPGDATVAVGASILLFVVPDLKTDREMLMDWKTCKNISWSTILLLGGGFALSKGIQESGVSTWIGLQLEFLENVPYYLLTPVLGTIINVITEFSSNVATATLFLPIFADVALSINVHPLLLMLPATFACSYAFMLPSGAPPNAIAYGTGYVNIRDMAKPGLFMHIVGLLLLSVLTPTLGAYMFGLNQSASSLPWLFT